MSGLGELSVNALSCVHYFCGRLVEADGVFASNLGIGDEGARILPML